VKSPQALIVTRSTFSEGALEIVKGWASSSSFVPGKRTKRNCPARCPGIGRLFARRVTSVEMGWDASRPPPHKAEYLPVKRLKISV